MEKHRSQYHGIIYAQGSTQAQVKHFLVKNNSYHSSKHKLVLLIPMKFKNGSKISGVLKLFPSIKLYSGELFSCEKNMVVRSRPKVTFSFIGLILQESNFYYQITSIMGKIFKGVCLSDSLTCDKVKNLNKNTNNSMGVNWTVQQSATSAEIDNTSFEFGHPVMPAA